MAYAFPVAGIYQWLNIINGYCYVGSAVNLQRRRSTHLRKLRNGTHNNPHLQSAFNQYGEESFIFQVLEEVPNVSAILEREQFHIDALVPKYNILQKAGNSLGFKHSVESLRKISEASKERPQTDEQRRKTSLSLKDRKKSEQTCLRMSMAKKGKPLSEKNKAALLASPGCKKTLIAIAPDGTEYRIHGISKFCREHVLDRHALMNVALGQRKHHRGWKARFPEAGTEAS